MTPVLEQKSTSIRQNVILGGVGGQGILTIAQAISSAALRKGLHSFELEYFKGPSRRHHGNLPDKISIRWEGPGFGLRRLTEADFVCSDDPDHPSISLQWNRMGEGLLQTVGGRRQCPGKLREQRFDEPREPTGGELVFTRGTAEPNVGRPKVR